MKNILFSEEEIKIVLEILKQEKISEEEIKIVLEILKQEKISVDEARMYGDDNSSSLLRSSISLELLIKKFEQEDIKHGIK